MSFYKVNYISGSCTTNKNDTNIKEYCHNKNNIYSCEGQMGNQLCNWIDPLWNPRNIYQNILLFIFCIIFSVFITLIYNKLFQ